MQQTPDLGKLLTSMLISPIELDRDIENRGIARRSRVSRLPWACNLPFFMSVQLEKGLV
jgi:hypothetical protein